MIIGALTFFLAPSFPGVTTRLICLITISVLLRNCCAAGLIFPKISRIDDPGPAAARHGKKAHFRARGLIG